MNFKIDIKTLFYLVVGALYLCNKYFGKNLYTIVGCTYVSFFVYLLTNRYLYTGIVVICSTIFVYISINKTNKTFENKNNKNKI